MDLSGFLGNGAVKEALSTAFSAGRFPHAVILQGESGVGKTAFARLLAKALVCRHPEKAPCGRCPSCIRAQAGSHPDIRIVEGGGKSGSLTVEAIRGIVEDASRMPEESSYNIYILEMGDQARPETQNKLLKVIEEPPQGGVFFLLCKNAQNLLPTIRSRAQVFTLLPPPEQQAAQWLAEHEGVEPGKAKELAFLCGGNLGKMRAGLKGGGAGQAFAVAKEMAESMLLSGGHRLLKAAAPVQKDKELFRAVLAKLAVVFRDACLLRCGGGGLLSGMPETAAKLSGLPMARLTRLAELMEEYRQRLERNANPALLVACLCADLRAG